MLDIATYAVNAALNACMLNYAFCSQTRVSLINYYLHRGISYAHRTVSGFSLFFLVGLSPLDLLVYVCLSCNCSDSAFLIGNLV